MNCNWTLLLVSLTSIFICSLGSPTTSSVSHGHRRLHFKLTQIELIILQPSLPSMSPCEWQCQHPPVIRMEARASLRGNKWRCLGQWHRQRVSFAQKIKRVSLEHLKERGRMEKPDLGFGLLDAYHQGNCVAMATVKTAPHLPSIWSAALTSALARRFRQVGCGPPEAA